MCSSSWRYAHYFMKKTVHSNGLDKYCCRLFACQWKAISSWKHCRRRKKFHKYISRQLCKRSAEKHREQSLGDMALSNRICLLPSRENGVYLYLQTHLLNYSRKTHCCIVITSWGIALNQTLAWRWRTCGEVISSISECAWVTFILQVGNL